MLLEMSQLKTNYIKTQIHGTKSNTLKNVVTKRGKRMSAVKRKLPTGKRNEVNKVKRTIRTLHKNLRLTSYWQKQDLKRKMKKRNFLISEGKAKNKKQGVKGQNLETRWLNQK